MTRDEHLEWAKDRALEYVEAGDLENAFMSMVSDLGKHNETAMHPGIQLGLLLRANGLLHTQHKMIEWIGGFN